MQYSTPNVFDLAGSAFIQWSFIVVSDEVSEERCEVFIPDKSNRGEMHN